MLVLWHDEKVIYLTSKCQWGPAASCQRWVRQRTAYLFGLFYCRGLPTRVQLPSSWWNRICEDRHQGSAPQSPGGLDLEISAEDRGLLLAEATQPPWVDEYNNTQNWESDFWDDLIKRRYAYRKHSAESNVNTMHPRLQSKPKKRSPRNLGFGESKKKEIHCFYVTGKVFNGQFCFNKNKEIKRRWLIHLPSISLFLFVIHGSFQ